MNTVITTAPTRFGYQEPRPFTQAEVRFRLALADYASAQLLSQLESRTENDPGSNQYNGLNVRLSNGCIFLEAILTHANEWGGFGFAFARFYPVNEQCYHFSVRRPEDWVRAERYNLSSASADFAEYMLSPPAVNWVRIAQAETFEQCIDLLKQHLVSELKSREVPALNGSLSR